MTQTVEGNRTTIGMVSRETRDRVAAFRDQRDHPNYEAALRELVSVGEQEFDLDEGETGSEATI